MSKQIKKIHHFKLDKMKILILKQNMRMMKVDIL